MKQMPWIDRRFAFDAPVSLFPALIERVRGTPPRLEDRLRAVSPALLTRRDRDTWSIQENAGHLLELEPLWSGRLDDFAAGISTLRPADIENRATTAAAYNERRLEVILAAFREARGKLVARLEELDFDSVGRTALHPRLGTPMRVIDMVTFIAEHDDHHIARISGLLRLWRQG